MVLRRRFRVESFARLAALTLRRWLGFDNDSLLAACGGGSGVHVNAVFAHAIRVFQI